MSSARQPTASLAWRALATRLAGACLVALACACTPPPVASSRVAAWEPIDPEFAGCHGACGGHATGPSEGVVTQPGASVGDSTYCPVSGAVFEIDGTHPHADVGGRTLYFCCTGCMEHFEAHRDTVLAARGIDAS